MMEALSLNGDLLKDIFKYAKPLGHNEKPATFQALGEQDNSPEDPFAANCLYLRPPRWRRKVVLVSTYLDIGTKMSLTKSTTPATGKALKGYFCCFSYQSLGGEFG